MTGHRKAAGKPLAYEAARLRSQRHFQARLNAALRPPDRVAVAASAVQSALRKAPDDVAQEAAIQVCDFLAAVVARLDSARPGRS